MEFVTLQKTNCQTVRLSEINPSNSPKKQRNNELQHHQTLCTPDAEPRKRDKKHPNPPLKGRKTPSASLRPAPFSLPSAHIRAPESRHQYLIPKPLLCQTDYSHRQK